MKFLPAVLLTFALCMVQAGCSRTESPDEVEEYDKNVDGATPLPPVYVTPGLVHGKHAAPLDLSDLKSSQPPVVAAPASTPSSSEADEVKAVVASMFQAVKDGNLALVTRYIPAELNQFIQPAVDGVSKGLRGYNGLRQAVESTFGPEGMKKLGSAVVFSSPLGNGNAQLKLGVMDNSNYLSILQYEVQDDLIVVAPPSNRRGGRPRRRGDQLLFQKVSGQWMIAAKQMGVKLPEAPAEREAMEKIVQIIGEMGTAAGEVFEQLTSEVHSGQLTADALASRAEQVIGEKVQPMIGQLIMAVMELQQASATPRVTAPEPITPEPTTPQPVQPAPAGPTDDDDW